MKHIDGLTAGKISNTLRQVKEDAAISEGRREYIEEAKQIFINAGTWYNFVMLGKCQGEMPGEGTEVLESYITIAEFIRLYPTMENSIEVIEKVVSLLCKILCFPQPLYFNDGEILILNLLIDYYYCIYLSEIESVK